MNQTGSRISWKDGVIVFLVLLLLAALVLLFLRPGEPARNLVFGDLGRRAASTNATPRGVPGVPPPFTTNVMSNSVEAAGNIPLTNNLVEQNAPRMEPGTNGQGVAMTEAGSNAPMIGPSSNSVAEGGGAPLSPLSTNPNPMAASNSMPLPSPTSPAPPARYVAGTSAHGKWVPEADAWVDPAHKDSTAKLLAEAKAANMAHHNPIPARTAELLGNDAPSPFFDSAAGSNVVFMLDDSIAATDGKSLTVRQEVRRALDSMNSNQLFYVVFFYSGGYEGMPSLSSLPATEDNVRAMTNWLFSVGYRAGADPTKAMQHVLSLMPAPDTVWLLSGSAVSDNVIDSIREANATTHVRVNTIGFYTQDGEQGLRRMADENRGVYRFVPPPNPSLP